MFDFSEQRRNSEKVIVGRNTVNIQILLWPCYYRSEFKRGFLQNILPGAFRYSHPAWFSNKVRTTEILNINIFELIDCHLAEITLVLCYLIQLSTLALGLTLNRTAHVKWSVNWTVTSRSLVHAFLFE